MTETAGVSTTTPRPRAPLTRREALAAERTSAAAQPLGAPSPAARVAALDVVRGLLLVASVLSSSLLDPPAWFDHAPWDGVHPLDVVFPSFVLLTGAGLGLAHRRGVRVGRLVRRVVVLVLAGVAYNAALAWAATGEIDPDHLRWTGVLQLYAAVVLVVALLHLVVRSWVGWTAVALALAGLHTALLARYATGCSGGSLTPDCNPSPWVDTAVVPLAHLHEQLSHGHDPEGFFGVLGACATAAAGTAAAHALLAARGRGQAAGVLRLLALAAVLALGAAAASPLVPTVKGLWTAPFGLGVAAVVVLVVATVHLVVDAPWTTGPGDGARALRAGRWALVALGRNSLLVYFGSHVLVAVLLLRPLGALEGGGPTWAQSLAHALAWLGGPQLGLSALLLALWWGTALVLHRRGWYLRA
ncbi:heparan-alpha-glucosaminide N-acetyltransferase domain-containing protein [Streptomyces sp. NP160]|uniref:heparan-alpha-glucosaminide N-acetyltransferase domain-containing protein n=1 Tax=Streptomyces sp. NP160 TaxID=2586637 RepID=UPI0015D65502|nr:heparan-alpha-glucosaminide N-acetyltransferase domain-containing protein [Streptomyces sp. NP160]